MHSILVVDDQEVFRAPLVEALRERGYEVREAGSAKAAMEDAARRIPSLFLLDFSLGDMDGLELLRYFRGRSVLRHVPVIMLTAHVRREYVATAATLGVGDYLLKSSFSLQELFSRIEARLASSIAVPSQATSIVPASTAPATPKPIPSFDSDRFLRQVELRAFPGAVAEILSMADDPNASLSSLEKVLRRDPGLSARVLSASQTAAFMRMTPTRSLEEAIQVLGLTEVVRIVASGAVLRKEDLESPWGRDIRLLWSHSIASGFLSQRLHSPKEEAFGFLVGLLHELAELMAIVHIGEKWEDIRNKGEGAGWSVTTALSEGFKSPFPKIARDVLLRMKLPTSLSAALREFYDLEEGVGSGGRESTRLVQLAHQCSTLVGRHGSTLAQIAPIRDRDLATVRSPEKLAEELPRMERDIQAWESLTGVPEEVHTARPGLPKLLYLRGDGYATPDPLEALLRRGTELERVEHALGLAGEADLKVVLAEPGTEAWNAASSVSGRVLLLHSGKIDRPPARTVRTMRLPLNEAKLESILREV
jgi:CheY-like chemotaxis protein/HD-like signal output (HDOD) protein